MGKKGPTRHLKRHHSPRFWAIHRKEKAWAVRTSPGPHRLRTSIPSKLILRDMLNYASNGREAKNLIKKGKIIVDGKTRKNERFPLGLMDVLSLPDSKENYRILPEKNGKLILHPITEEESKYKLEKVVNKTTVKNGLTQLNFHDGKNILVSEEEGATINVNDVLKVSVPNMETINKISYGIGNNVLIVGGRRHGERGTLTFFGNEPGNKRTAIIRTPAGENIQTLERYVFSIGTDEPEISLPTSSFFDKNEE